MYLLQTLVMHWITLDKKKLIICLKGENVEFGIFENLYIFINKKSGSCCCIYVTAYYIHMYIIKRLTFT